MRKLTWLAAALLLASCSAQQSGSTGETSESQAPPVQTVNVKGYVIVEADFFATGQAQRLEGGAACVNDPAANDISEGSQVLAKDAEGTAIDVFTLDQGYAQWPPGHTDSSPANELSCVYAFRSAAMEPPSGLVSFELAGHPPVTIKIDETDETLRPMIIIAGVNGDWTDYRMEGD